jgi:hypothetical protein
MSRARDVHHGPPTVGLRVFVGAAVDLFYPPQVPARVRTAATVLLKAIRAKSDADFGLHIEPVMHAAWTSAGEMRLHWPDAATYANGAASDLVTLFIDTTGTCHAPRTVRSCPAAERVVALVSEAVVLANEEVDSAVIW